MRGRLSIAKLQDALHFALMSVGGYDRAGREGTFVGRSSQRRRQWGFDPPNALMTRHLWEVLARQEIYEMGLEVPRLKGERLIRYIDRLAHSIGYDAYSSEKIEHIEKDPYGLHFVANRKVKGRKVKGRHVRRTRSG